MTMQVAGKPVATSDPKPSRDRKQQQPHSDKKSNPRSRKHSLFFMCSLCAGSNKVRKDYSDYVSRLPHEAQAYWTHGRGEYLAMQKSLIDAAAK